MAPGVTSANGPGLQVRKGGTAVDLEAHLPPARQWRPQLLRWEQIPEEMA